jgi:hypothetical protein
MPFMDFLNQLAKGWNEGANQGLETDWATRQALEQKKKELETLFPIKLRQQGETLAQAEPFALRKIAASHVKPEDKETFHTVGKNLYSSKRGWIPGAPGGAAESPTQGINEIVGYDITKGPRADVPPAEQMEGFDQMAKPELMTAIKDRVKAGPTTNVTVQPIAGGNYGMRIAPASVPASDLNAWAQTETERLVNTEGWDRAAARLAVSNMVSEMLAKRAGLRQGETTQAQITTEFGTPANVDTVAAGKAKIAADTERAKSNVGFERPPTALPQPTGAPGTPSPIDQPPPGMNRQQTEAWQKSRAGAVADTLPASERARFSELYTLVDSIAELRKLTHDFDVETAGGWFGPIRGYVTGPFEESLTGSMSPEEVKARRVMYDMSDMLLRARSGAQINEQEYARLAKLLALPERPFNTAKARFEDFERQLLTIIKNRSMLQSAPAGNLPPPTRPIQTPENTLRFDNRGRRVK